MKTNINNLTKKWHSGLFSVLALFTFAIFSQTQAAAPSWDIIGNWDIDYFVEDGLGGLSFTVLNENFQTGTFSAFDNNFNQAFSGTVSGSDINFTDYQNEYDSFGNPFLNLLSIEGSIAANGTMSGPMDQYNGGTDWHGSFSTVSGEATAVVPEPSTWAMMVAGVGVMFASRRRLSFVKAFNRKKKIKNENSRENGFQRRGDTHEEALGNGDNHRLLADYRKFTRP